jgi:transcription-repair coupling factor (superfamily II helicase)
MPNQPLQPLLATFFSQTIQDFLGQRKEKQKKRFSMTYPPGCGDAYLLAQQIEAYQDIPHWVVVTEQVEDAVRLQDELSFFMPNIHVALFPDWEILPFDQISPHQDLISERLSILYGLLQKQIKVLVVAANTLVHRLAPPSFLAGRVFFLKQGQTLDTQQMKEQLTLAGYHSVQQVLQPGEFAVRGGILDLFPMGSPLPYRLDLFGDTIESIKVFDVDNQKSLYAVPEIRLLPGREFPTDEAARLKFRENFRAYFEGDPTKALIYKDLGNGSLSAGIENYLPFFFDETASLFDYLPVDTLLVELGMLEVPFGARLDEAKSRYDMYKYDSQRPILNVNDLFWSSEDLFVAIKSFNRLHLRDELAFEMPSIQMDRHQAKPLQAFVSWQATIDKPILLVAETAGRQETLQSLLMDHASTWVPITDFVAFKNSLQEKSEVERQTVRVITHGTLHEGAWLDSFWVITEEELYQAKTEQRSLHGRSQSRRGRHRSISNKQETDVDRLIKDLVELNMGDAVVHHQYGVGRYLGLIELDVGGEKAEFLHLEYAKQANLYVPVEQLYLINRYTGQNPESAPLHTLGSDQWEKARRKAAEQIRDTAAELLNLYAQRSLRRGHSFRLDLKDYRAFCEGFGFEETPDQHAAIEAVIADMQRSQPMDRLVCGDVGFGKTEVALRAAFVAVMNGKQVALLAPTTLLVEQHYQTFSDRFAAFGAKVAELSRFNSGKETKAIIEQIAEGRVDIVIGTHQLLSSNVHFKDLGLVMIDEEHRFGVRHKEALKSLRAEVDVLTLTATPIPRTLSMSLEGIRDFSVIATAPQKRLAIKTFVRPETKSVIKEAILRETLRGGQVYFLHNRVETIHQRALELQEWLPDIRIAVAHGQMPERDLAQTMRDFAHQKMNVLVCSTIIETGIDIPTANTIMIHRADKFGIAQLHQLRGRVGRSHHQAYAYLLVPEDVKLDSKAERRLDAIATTEELGSGFYLAMHDLEIRGAGELLGESQSGSMQEIGFTLYQDMLKMAIDAAKRGEIPDFDAPLKSGMEIHLGQAALIPKEYCVDVQERLSMYKRIVMCRNEDQLSDLREGLRDRYGEFPDATKALFEAQKLRVRYQPMGLSKIEATDQTLVISFHEKNKVDAAKVMRLIQSNRQITLMGTQKIKWVKETKTWVDRARLTEEFLKMVMA